MLIIAKHLIQGYLSYDLSEIEPRYFIQMNLLKFYTVSH